MSNLASLSHDICASHAASLKEEKSSGGKSSSSSSPSSPKPVKIELPPAPAASKKITEKEIEKFEKEKEKKDQEKKKAELIRKITQYSELESLAHVFPDGLKERGSKISYKDSLETVEGTYEEFMSCLKQNHKKIFVNMMFDQFCNASEIVLVNIAKKPEKQGIGMFLAMNKEKLLHPELDELMIEMSDAYIPGPWARAAMKIANLMMLYDVNLLSQQQMQGGSPASSNNSEEKEEKERENAESSSSSSSNPSAKRFPAKVPHKRSK